MHQILNNVTVLLKFVHAVHQCIDNGSILEMTSFRQLVFTGVLVLISSLHQVSPDLIFIAAGEGHVCF